MKAAFIQLSSSGNRKKEDLHCLAATSSEDMGANVLGDHTSYSIAGSQEGLSSLSDFCGDIVANMRSLSYGRCCYDCVLSASVPPISSPLVSQFQSKNSWHVVHNSVQFRPNGISPMNGNGVVPRKAYYPMNPPVLHGSGFGMEDMPKPRGTGTYFPNPSRYTHSNPLDWISKTCDENMIFNLGQTCSIMKSYKDRSLTPWGRNPAPARSHNNGHAVTPPEPNSPERWSPELAQIQTPDRLVEFGSIGALPLVPASTESSQQHNPGSPYALNSTSCWQQLGNQRLSSTASMDQDRFETSLFHRKFIRSRVLTSQPLVFLAKTKYRHTDIVNC
ncbi:hypothetical protein F3Y22_tig00000778pilonHSYRG00049 [Hibiscus syriacus]|uniref:Uncharacterized protein n=1 Tax=Hibiscus syriacus TaxID=106335 RepID=A0A6A3CXJ5_HIBSY|nr:hypothetical protein F3Y22_tig00000778pilonHSYRG00049 [Hibiscus syriacus]